MKDISKLYDQLSPRERVMATLDAMSRDDREEVDRLVRTCPHRTYKGTDPAYVDRVDASRLVTAACYMDLNRVIGLLRLLDALKEHLLSQKGLQRWLHAMVFEGGLHVDRSSVESRGADFAGPEAKVVQDADSDLDAALEAACERMDVVAGRLYERLTGFLNKLIDALVLDLATLWDAFGRFSRSEIGLEPVSLLAAWGLRSDELLQLLAAHPNIEPDQTVVASYADVLTERWTNAV